MRSNLVVFDNRSRAENTGELIDELGGNAVVSALCGGLSMSTVSQWRTRGFPPWVYSRLIRECGIRRIAYDPALFESHPRGRKTPRSNHRQSVAGMQIYQQIGQMIRQRRKDLGLSQDQLAGAIGMSHGQLSRLENGLHGILVHTIYDIAEALDCLPGELVPKPRRRRPAGAA